LSPTTAGRLNGEVAIVTGATSGLGIEIARLFVAEGARVVITGRNAERGAKAAVRTRAEFVRADLSNDDDLAALVDHTATRLARVADMHLTRIPTATDVAYAVLYLASRESEVISGVALPVDGGSSAVRGRTLG
jgi:NAD(P)-dependent dehydrogenase (short-subunit alcohol dehydrogenase family)